MPTSSHALADDLRAIERERLRTLVAFDLHAALPRFADDFQLINPGGQPWSREEYLGHLQAGRLVYHTWEPVSEIAVRAHGDAAILRYQAFADVEGGGHRITGTAWFTDFYERRDEQWQVVWSQATLVATE